MTLDRGLVAVPGGVGAIVRGGGTVTGGGASIACGGDPVGGGGCAVVAPVVEFIEGFAEDVFDGSSVTWGKTPEFLSGLQEQGGEPALEWARVPDPLRGLLIAQLGASIT